MSFIRVLEPIMFDMPEPNPEEDKLVAGVLFVYWLAFVIGLLCQLH